MVTESANANSRPVVVFDGTCNFCLRQVEKIRRRDRRSLFEIVPRQEPSVEQRFPLLAEGDFDSGMRLVEPDGRILVGADAVHAIARRLTPWKWAAWLYLVPGLKHLFRWIYAWIARNRHRLAGRCETGACGLPTDGSTSGRGGAHG